MGYDIAIQVESLGKKYKFGGSQKKHDTLRDSLVDFFKGNFRRQSGKNEKGKQEFWALKDISFEVKPGEVVGIIGRNGAGKSTLLKTLARITEPSAGTIDIYGRVGSLLEVGTGFHQELTGRENIYLSGSILGMKKSEIDRHFDEIVDFAEVEKFIDTPVKHYSSGMYLRLAFGVAAFLQPEILLVDEVLAVGDVAFQRKCLGKMSDVVQQGRTVLFVSHNMSAILELCERALLIENGRLAFDGKARECIEAYYRYNSMEEVKEMVMPQNTPLEVNSLKINDGNLTSVKAGSAFNVNLQLYGHNIQNPAIYFIIENVAGQIIIHKRIKSKELGLDTIDGQYKLKVSLPALWLSPGIYSIYFKFIAPATYWSGKLQSERIMLEVRGEMEGTGKAILNPEVKWNVEYTKRFDHIENQQEYCL